MNSLWYKLIVPMTLTLVLSLPERISATDVVVLQGGTLMAGTCGEPLHGAESVVRGGRIHFAGPLNDVEIPDDFRVLDTTAVMMIHESFYVHTQPIRDENFIGNWVNRTGSYDAKIGLDGTRIPALDKRVSSNSMHAASPVTDLRRSDTALMPDNNAFQWLGSSMGKGGYIVFQ